MELKLGDVVTLTARVNSVINPNSAPASQQASLQLRDGAGLVTAILNIDQVALAPADTEPEETDSEEKAIHSPPAHKAITKKRVK